MLTGKDVIYKTFAGEVADRIPWVPFAGVHAGKLKGYTAREVLTDEDKLVESLLEVNKIYHPDGMPVIFDLQIEAEILGCDLKWEDDAPPSVISHPLAGVSEIPDQIPEKTEDRLPMIIRVMEKVKKEIGDETALYGLICGPFTLASHLRGTDIFMDMITDSEYVEDLLEYTLKISKVMSEYYIEAGMDIIAVVDPLVSQISPAHFQQFLSEPFQELFHYIRDKGALSSFFVCGDASKNLEVMCETAPDGISIDENISLKEAKAITDQYDICLGGNIPLTTIMLFGTQQDNMKYVIDLLDEVDTDNLIISPGCDMPYDVPLENTIAVEQAVHQPEQTREMLVNYEKVEEEIDIELPDYTNLKKPLVEVFTLDSATCAACTYMMAAADEVKKHFGDSIELKEYKYTSKENIARTKKMGVRNLPSLYVNGELKFSSIIPDRNKLIEVINECVQQKV
ncbi:MAG: uroporphyrinogen decarboxylase family protein [Halanaerobiales bacterium]